MKTQPLISIALCTYNGEKHLKEQVDSLVNQTYKNLEIIAVDDRSTDSTFDMLTDYANRFPNFKVVKNATNLGHTKNFEKAIGLCKGEFIALSDQDDVWDLNKISILQENIGSNTLIYHDSAFVSETGEYLDKNFSTLMNMYEGSSCLPLLFFNCVAGHACMFRADLRKHLGGFTLNFHHDWWIALNAANYGRIKYLNQVLVQYRQHGNSYTDILKLREDTTEPGKNAALNLLWLKNIATRVERLSPFVNKIIKLHEDNNIISSFRLMLLIGQHYKLIYFTKKKSDISNLNHVRKLLNNKSDFLPRKV